MFTRQHGPSGDARRDHGRILLWVALLVLSVGGAGLAGPPAKCHVAARRDAYFGSGRAPAGVAPLERDSLRAIADAAAERWRATGLSEEQEAALDAISYTIEDLPGQRLGSAESTRVKLDIDADGLGWFIDATPDDDAEFAGDAGRLTALDGPAKRAHDLLSVLLHEQGHVLGLEDRDLGDPGHVMGCALEVGTRRTPAPGLAAGRVPVSLVGERSQIVRNASDSVAGESVDTLKAFTLNAGEDRVLFVFTVARNEDAIVSVAFDGTPLLPGTCVNETPNTMTLSLYFTYPGSGPSRTGDVVVTRKSTDHDDDVRVIAAVAYDGVSQSLVPHFLAAPSNGLTVRPGKHGDRVVGAAFNQAPLEPVGLQTTPTVIHRHDGFIPSHSFTSSDQPGRPGNINHLYRSFSYGDVRCIAFNLEPAPLPVADVSVSLSSSPNPALPGGQITYTVTVRNAGPDPARNVTSHFAWSSALSQLVSSGTSTDPFGYPVAALAEIPPGDSVQYTITADVAPDVTSSFDATVGLQSMHLDDPDLSDNSASETTDVRISTHLEPIGNDLVIDDSAGVADDLTIEVIGADYVFSDPGKIFSSSLPGASSSAPGTIRIPLSAFSGAIIVNGRAGNDRLTLRFPATGFATDVVYNGGDGDDVLEFAGHARSRAEYSFTGPGAGTVRFDGTTVTYTGLE